MPEGKMCDRFTCVYPYQEGKRRKKYRIKVTIISAHVILPYSISSITVNSPHSSTQSMAKQVM